MIPILDAETNLYETPQIVRFTNYFGAMWWNCVAVYSDTHNDALTKVRPVVAVTDSTLHTATNKAVCAAQATVTYSQRSLPGAVTGVREVLAGIGLVYTQELLLPAVAACGTNVGCLQFIASSAGYNPIVMGQIIAILVLDYAMTDGFNELGTDEGLCTVNCRSYRDPVSNTISNEWCHFMIIVRYRGSLHSFASGFSTSDKLPTRNSHR
jgi:hypothetical protein